MWGLIVFLIGLLYGWLSPGRQNKGRLLVNGLWIGLLLAIVFTLLGVAIGYQALSLGGNFVAIFLTVVVLTLLFILGAWIGDLIEGAQGRTKQRAY